MFSHFGDIILNKPVKEKPKDKKLPPLNVQPSREVSECSLNQTTTDLKSENLKKPIANLDTIRTEIKKIHETVSTVQSLIPLVKDGNDGQNLIKQLHGTNERFQNLLPLMNTFMGDVPPADELDLEVWKLERDNLCREFESSLTNFQTVQKGVMDALKGLGKEKGK